MFRGLISLLMLLLRSLENFLWKKSILKSSLRIFTRKIFTHFCTFYVQPLEPNFQNILVSQSWRRSRKILRFFFQEKKRKTLLAKPKNANKFKQPKIFPSPRKCVSLRWTSKLSLSQGVSFMKKKTFKFVAHMWMFYFGEMYFSNPFSLCFHFKLDRN